MKTQVLFGQVQQDLDAYLGPPVDADHIRPGSYWRLRPNHLGADAWLDHMPGAFVRIHAEPCKRPGAKDHQVLGWSLLDDRGPSPVEVFRLDGFTTTEEALVLALELQRREQRIAAAREL